MTTLTTATTVALHGQRMKSRPSKLSGERIMSRRNWMELLDTRQCSLIFQKSWRRWVLTETGNNVQWFWRRIPVKDHYGFRKKYYKELDEILGHRPASVPAVLLDTGTTSQTPSSKTEDSWVRVFDDGTLLDQQSAKPSAQWQIQVCRKGVSGL